MTIDEAIKKLEIAIRNENYYRNGDYTGGMKLGIEALKVIKEYHDYFLREGVVPLPGETEE